MKRRLDDEELSARLERTLERLAEEEPFDAKRHADAVMASLDAPRERSAPSRLRRSFPFILGSVAAAAALFIGIGIGRGTRSQEGEFVARGGTPVDAPLDRGVGVSVSTLEADETPRLLAPGATVTRSTRFVASHRNTGREQAYALVIAVDEIGDVHWLYPAYETPGTDPESIVLSPTEGRERLHPTAVSFEDLPPGRLSIVIVLTRAPLRVSQIERMGSATADQIRRDHPEASVTSLDVRVKAE